MANLQLFKSFFSPTLPLADTVNEAGGAAYSRSSEAALALYACTGCLNGTFYADAEMQLAQTLVLCRNVSPAFVLKTALYARRHAYMKDMPALLMCYLAATDGVLLEQGFARVIDNGRMLRNFVQILRSGAVGRKSLGSRPKRLVQQWLETASVEKILAAAVGEKPSLADIVRMMHPKPHDKMRAALYAWLIGKSYTEADLPPLVQVFEAFKRDPSAAELPEVPFQYLTALPLSSAHWAAIAQRASWQTTRMNLNTYLRRGVFNSAALVEQIAERLRDPKQIAQARVLPYQLLSAYKAAAGTMPQAIIDALQDAMEIATANVPTLAGAVAVAIDVSGSMASPVTGVRKGATSVVRCVDVAALIAACLKRRNPAAQILPFAETVVDLHINARDTVMTQAAQMAALCGGGTNVSAAIAQLNAQKAKVDLLVVVSDNQSWMDLQQSAATATMHQWELLRRRCPGARMVCIDLQPYATSQTVERPDVLHIGGFSDAVFTLLAEFAAHGTGAEHWAARIGQMSLQ